MKKEIEEKFGNLQAQRKQVKLELTELEEALLKRKELLNKLDGAIEFASSLINDKKEKQDA